MAFASAGMVLSSTPPLMMVRAVVVRILAFISGMGTSQRFSNGPNSHTLEKATWIYIGAAIPIPAYNGRSRRKWVGMGWDSRRLRARDRIPMAVWGGGVEE